MRNEGNIGHIVRDIDHIVRDKRATTSLSLS